MSVELLYTSAVQGLKQGSRGFCTVISTAGMPINLATRLEGLSAYRHIYPPNHPDAAKNPVNFSHLRINVGGRTISILSRVADYGIDYSQRTNKLAHHVVVEAHEQTPAGPAWLMQSTSILRSRWDGQCATPASGPTIPMQDQAGKICTTWKSLSGDAGWGGVVADTFASAVGKPLWIIYDLGQREQLLALLNEAIALLPHEKRWSATFSTYATNVPPDADCKVRCVPAGSDDARLAPAMGKVIDLTKKQSVPAVTELVTAAREGIVFTPKPVPSAPRPIAVETPQVHSAVPQSDVNDFELVEDDFEMKLKPIGPPSVNSSHLPPSPPPAVRSRPTPQPNYAQLAPDTPDSNSWMKWALIGASVTIVCLIIAIGGLMFSMKSKDVAQKEEKPAANVEVKPGEEVSPVESENAEDKASSLSPADKLDAAVNPEIVQTTVDEPQMAVEKVVPSPSMNPEPKQSELPQSMPESSAEKTEIKELGESSNDKSEESLNEEEKIEIATVDAFELLTEGKVKLKVTVVMTFSGQSVSLFKDENSPAAVGLKVKLPYEWVDDKEAKSQGSARKRITSIDPLIIEVFPRLKVDDFKEESNAIKEAWDELKKEARIWNKKCPDWSTDFEDPGRKEDFASFRKRLNEWSSRYAKICEWLDKKNTTKEDNKVNPQSSQIEELRNQLEIVNAQFKKLCSSIDAISSERVFESGNVFFIRKRDETVDPLSMEGREPFSFNYRIESGVSGEESNALQSEKLQSQTKPPQPLPPSKGTQKAIDGGVQ